MFIKKYRFKFYLNARHTIKIGGLSSNIHPHTWEIVLYVKKKGEGFVEFTKLEKSVQEYLSKFEGNLLNDVPPLSNVNPTLENIGDNLSEQISEILVRHEWSLENFEISENPSRTYIVSKDRVSSPGKNIYMTEAGAHLYDMLESYNKEVAAANEPAAMPPVQLQHSGNNLSTESIQLAAPIPADTINPGKITEVSSSLQNPGSTAVDSVIHKRDSTESRTFTREGNYRLKKSKRDKSLGKILFFSSFIIVLAASYLLYYYITKNGIYPWGSDTWGHIYKAKMLYQKLSAGELFPLYDSKWYNGVQPFRYWAPLPYYVISLFMFVSKGNEFIAYNLFIAFIFVIGAYGWLFWGKKTGRIKLGLIIALMWFFMPENLRVLFADGNIPRVMVMGFIPYLLLGIWGYFENVNVRSFILVVICSFLITISHAMISAITGITVFLFAVLYGIINRKTKRALVVIFAEMIGILLSGIWLFPALQGGLVSMSSGATLEVMKSMTFDITQSLNPFIRQFNAEQYYYGASVLVISLLGIIFGGRKTKAGFGVAIIIFVGTTKVLLSVLVKMPLSQLLWMIEFTPLAMGTFLSSLLLWDKLKRKFLLILLFLLLIDCGISFTYLCFDREYPCNLKQMIDNSFDKTTQRVAVLDKSQFGSFSSYYLDNNDNGKKFQVYGWAWQGAKTASNIVGLNTAIDKHWYPYLFDRCTELGADTLIVKKDLIKDDKKFLYEASECNYQLYDQNTLSMALKLKSDGAFGTRTEYLCFGIGTYAVNVSYIFPQTEVGSSIYIDDYSRKKLLGYHTVFLSGFKYRDKMKAGNLVKELSSSGVRVVIDMTGAEENLYTSRASFLGVNAQPVEFRERFPILNVLGKEAIFTEKVPEEYYDWRTAYLENLDKVFGNAEFQGQKMNFFGTKYNDNIIFIGFNLPFFAVETQDSRAIGILEQVLDMKANQRPQRELVPVKIESNTNKIKISSEKEGVIVPISLLDSFVSNSKEYKEVNNLVCMEGKQLQFRIVYPYLKEGLALSLSAFIILFASCILILRARSKRSDINMVSPDGKNGSAA